MMASRTPHQFFAPLASGAPAPTRQREPRVERVFHFFPPHIDKIRDGIAATAKQADMLVGNLEDAIPIEAKAAAREGFIAVAKSGVVRAAGAGLWVRINGVASPFHLDDVGEIVAQAGNAIDGLVVPKVDGPWDIHFLDQYLALLEARHGIARPIAIHGVIETAQGVANVEAIAGASPRLHGLSLGPADLAASRGMKTTRIGGGHPGYRVIEDPRDGGRASVQQDLWHYTIARLVDACVVHGIKPYYGPFGAIDDDEGCAQQFRNAFLLGCAGAWSLHPRQIAIAQRIFTPDAGEVARARRILALIPEAGVAMIDGQMIDDASWKQAQVLVGVADLIAAKAD